MNKETVSCKQYGIAKSYKLPFVFSHAKAAKQFDLLYLDLLVAPKETYIGDKYFLSIVDDNSIFIWIFFFQIKSQVPSIFIQFKQMLERPFGIQLKSIQMMGGTEFKPLVTLLEREGVVHHCTYPSPVHKME